MTDFLTYGAALLPSSLKVSMLAYAALGAFVHWWVLKYGKNPAEGAEMLTTDILGEFRLKVLMSVLFVVSVGALVSVGMISPTTNSQAIAGGMAWTTLIPVSRSVKK